MVVLKNGSFSFIFFREYRPGKFVLRYSSKETRFGLKITFITKGKKSSYISALGFPHRLASVPDRTKSEMIKLHCGVTVKWTLQEKLSYSSHYPHSKISLWPAIRTKSSQYSRKLIRQCMLLLSLLPLEFVKLLIGAINLVKILLVSVKSIAFMKTREGMQANVKEPQA